MTEFGEPDFVLPGEQLDTLKNGRWTYHTDDAVFHLTGPGTIDCVQGILSNDIVKAGAQALVWGAFLTAKGAIITDLWVKRDGAAVWLIVPRIARDAVSQLITRSFPPRLTKAVDRTDDVKVHWLVAPTADEASAVPGAILPYELAPFTALVMTEGNFEEPGWESVGGDWAAAQKVLLEWPTLGREIGERTLVQEVRFDELQGVKYDKGCFTGQETVARLHFRGHANKGIARIPLDNPPNDTAVWLDGEIRGHITTWGILGEECVALAMMKTERGARSEERGAS